MAREWFVRSGGNCTPAKKVGKVGEGRRKAKAGHLCRCPAELRLGLHLLFLCDLRDLVTQPDTQHASVTLTTTISIIGAIDAKAFPIAVQARMTDTQAVAAAKTRRI